MKILKINSSANKINSLSRHQVDNITTKLKDKHTSAEVIDRDVAYSNLPYLDQDFLGAMFERGQLSPQQQETLSFSDELIDEIKSSDILVIGAPMYNFSVPSSLKSYFDLIARPGKTFNYTNTGAITGLISNTTAFVVTTTGGTPIGSNMDHSTGYIKTFLNFIGISDIHFIDFDQTGFKYQEKLMQAKTKLDSILAS